MSTGIGPIITNIQVVKGTHPTLGWAVWSELRQYDGHIDVLMTLPFGSDGVEIIARIAPAMQSGAVLDARKKARRTR